MTQLAARERDVRLGQSCHMSGTKNAVHFVMNRTQRAKMSARYYTHSDHGVLKNSKTLFNISQM